MASDSKEMTKQGADVDPRNNTDRLRRSLLTGMAAAPVLASLPSRSAWGGACSISGLLSGNLSRPAGTFPDCRTGGEGKTPGYWKTHPLSWPVPFGDTYIYYGTADVQLINPCERPYAQKNGQLHGNWANYTYIGGATLNDLLNAVLAAAGSSLSVSGFDKPPMYYLQHDQTGAWLATHVSAALLNALHDGVAYEYTALEIAEAVASISYEQEETLKDIFDTLNNSDIESDSLVVYCSL